MARERVAERAAQWRVSVDEIVETDGSIISYGRRESLPVVLKVFKQRGDEWRSGEALDAFAGAGAARVYEYVEGALLLERLDPGTSLANRPLSGGDDEATQILADVIGKLSPGRVPTWCPTVKDLAKSFKAYAASGPVQLPAQLVEHARQLYVELSESQSRPRLLHGDLHHYNVLLDTTRGWLAIDPKGVVGELEFEIGAALRNPRHRPELFVQRSIIERRTDRFGEVEDVVGAAVFLASESARFVTGQLLAVDGGFLASGVNQ